MTDLVLTREERLENPGGIEHESGIIWHGQTLDQPDPRFVKFLRGYGVRAIGRCLHTYVAKDGVRTIAQAIERWAPPGENDTKAYIEDVCQHCQATPDSLLDLGTQSLVITKAIIHHENGRVIYTDDDLTTWLSLA